MPDKNTESKMPAAKGLFALFMVLILSITVLFAGGLPSQSQQQNMAYASEYSEARDELNALQEKINQAEEEYHIAQDEIDALEQAKAELQSRIDELEKQLEPERKKLGEIEKWKYQYGIDGLLQCFLEADTLDSLLYRMEIVNKVEESEASVMSSISAAEAELKTQQGTLTQQQLLLTEKQNEANQVKESIQPDIDAVNAKLKTLRAELIEELGYSQGNGSPAYAVEDGMDIVEIAFSRVGCPYVWGASGPNTFDCSGFTMWCYQQAYGISLPHYTGAQYAAADEILPVSQAQPGDILYTDGHVGLCVSNNDGDIRYVHAPHTGANVRATDSMSWSRFSCALRFYH